MIDQEFQEQILLVDDNPANLDLLSQVLMVASYRIRTALSGRQALESARLAPPDLILLDISMPEMDGFEVCRMLKQEERLRDIPVVFISALDDVLDKVKAFQAGGADYVTKPFQAEEVLARVEYQVQLRRLRQQLEERNRVLAEAYAGLQELDQLKASFTSMLVHDLRSPLSGIQMVLDLVEEDGTIKPSHLAQCRQSIQGTICILNDLLELYRCEGSEIHLELAATAPWSLLEGAKGSFTLQAARQKISLECVCHENLPSIQVEAHKVERILANLIGNALKFTPAGGKIRLEASVVEGGGVDLGLRWVLITVTDTGRGIPPEKLPYIFDPYRQVSSGDAKRGFGLGLAIVQRLMTAHLGRVMVCSQVGVGTTFSLYFPLDGTQAPAQPDR